MTHRHRAHRSAAPPRSPARSAAFAPLAALALAAFVALLAATSLAAQALPRAAASPEQETARYFESVRSQPLLLQAFLREMPKGGDLHNHLSGSVYAESYLAWAAADGLCIVLETLAAAAPPCDAAAGRPAATAAFQDGRLYTRVIDAWSLRNWDPSQGSGHDRFFSSFGRFSRAANGRTADMLVEVTNRAAAGGLLYLELMHTPETRSSALGRSVGWDDDMAGLRDRLLAAGMAEAVAAGRAALDTVEARRRAVQRCDAAEAEPGCGVTVRYLYQVRRAVTPDLAFAQILAAFMMATEDPRVVGLNLVQPEDGPLAMSEYSRQMRIIGFLSSYYPTVPVTLHAGELAPGLVPPEGLRFHIREAVEVAGARRIGHGVAIMYEERPFELLRTMADRNVLVEICLTSNDVILGVRGDEHPLHIYLQHGVPTALATDDEGVARSEMTMEFLKAAREQGLDYPTLKGMARNSLEHAFVEGESLWADARGRRLRPECAGTPGAAPTPPCQSFLDAHPKARLQWSLERALDRFEAGYAAGRPAAGR
jgi:adenosine deaminase